MLSGPNLILGIKKRYLLWLQTYSQDVDIITVDTHLSDIYKTPELSSSPKRQETVFLFS